MMEAMTQADVRPEARPRRRASAKTSSPKAAPKADRVKATILLSTDADVRLTVHAKLLGLDRSELVDQLIRDGCRRFVVQDRGKSAGEASLATGDESAT